MLYSPLIYFDPIYRTQLIRSALYLKPNTNVMLIEINSIQFLGVNLTNFVKSIRCFASSVVVFEKLHRISLLLKAKSKKSTEKKTRKVSFFMKWNLKNVIKYAKFFKVANFPIQKVFIECCLFQLIYISFIFFSSRYTNHPFMLCAYCK